MRDARNSTRSASITNNSASPRAKLGYGHLHNAVDDYSRLAYRQIVAEERKDTAAAFWARAEAWFASYGIPAIARVLTDNGSCYRSHTWREAVAATETRHLRTRAYRHKPTAKSNGSTAPNSTNGPTRPNTPAKPADVPTRSGLPALVQPPPTSASVISRIHNLTAQNP